jgi:hypothetical protein
MILASLKEAFGLIGSRPVLWFPGVVAGLLVFIDIMTGYYGGTFLTGRLWIIEVLVIPFLAGGLFLSVKTGDISFGNFFSGGRKFYFRILLPGLVITFAAILTVLLLMLPMALIGLSAVTGIVAGAAFGVLVPFIFFTYFFDAVAVFEETKVFETIRRSIEMTIRNMGTVFKFYIVNILIVLVVSFFMLIAWSATLVDRLTALTTMNTTEISTITPDTFFGLLGADGVLISAVILALGTGILVTILATYKACFFKALAGLTPAAASEPMLQGEYDSKGRWYKY